MESLSNTTEEAERLKKDPFHCTGPGLRGHIVNIHFAECNTSTYGTALFDIGVAEFRGFPLDWVVKQAYKRLEEDDDLYNRRIQEDFQWFDSFPKARNVFLQNGRDYFNPNEHRATIVRDLILIERRKLAVVDWDRVYQVPYMEEVTLDLSRDTSERPFRPYKGLSSIRLAHWIQKLSSLLVSRRSEVVLAQSA